MDKARTTEINHFNFTPRVRLDQDVFRLQVAVNQLESVDVIQGIKNLLSDSLQSGNVEVKFLFNFPVVLGILV